MHLTKKVEFVWEELCQLGDLPAAGTHDGLHHGGNFLQSLEGFFGPWKVRQVAVAHDQWVVLRHLDC